MFRCFKKTIHRTLRWAKIVVLYKCIQWIKCIQCILCIHKFVYKLLFSLNKTSNELFSLKQRTMNKLVVIYNLYT